MSGDAQIEAATLTDLTGRSVRSFSLQPNANHELDVHELPAGWYVLSLTVNGQLVHKRISVLR